MRALHYFVCCGDRTRIRIWHGTSASFDYDESYGRQVWCANGSPSGNGPMKFPARGSMAGSTTEIQVWLVKPWAERSANSRPTRTCSRFIERAPNDGGWERIRPAST